MTYEHWLSGLLYRVFHVHANLDACCTSEGGGGGGSGTHKSAQELTRKDGKTGPHPAPPGNQAHGLCQSLMGFLWKVN